jgi:hypothetical protein
MIRIILFIWILAIMGCATAKPFVSDKEAAKKAKQEQKAMQKYNKGKYNEKVGR